MPSNNVASLPPFPSSSKSVFTAAPTTELVDYVITNSSLLPVGVAKSLAELESEWKEGELTRRGYLKRRDQLLEDFPHLRQSNGSVVFGEGAGEMGGASRKLLSVDREPIAVQGKSLSDDIIRAVSDWEHRYGHWVSGWSQGC